MTINTTMKGLSQFLERFADGDSTVYWLVEPGKRRFAYISPAFEKIWGLPCQVLYDDPLQWNEFLHAEDRVSCHPIFSLAEKIHLTDSPANYQATYRIVGANNRVHWIFDKGFPIFDEQGKCCAIAGTAIDITGQKQKENSLLEARDRAEAASHAKSDFLATISHELRIPLTGIIGMAQLLNLECLLPPQQEQVNDIIKASGHLMALLDDLLDVTKLEGGKIILHLVPVDFKRLLEEIVAVLQFQAKAKGLELILSYDSQAPKEVIADHRALQQIAFNLISNAIKFTEKGYVRVSVSTLSQVEEQLELLLKIEDTGSGINTDKLDAIFERFAQTESYKRRYGTGAGLGLTISKAYLDLMGGDMQVQSQTGRGSTFSCRLPLILQSAISQSSPWDVYRNKIRILLVSDSLATDQLLQILGGTFCQSVSGIEALHVLLTAQRRGYPYDILVVDSQLMSMNSLQLIQSIAQQRGLRLPMPVLFVAKNVVAAEQSFVNEEDFFACLHESVGSNKLLRQLTDAWEKWEVQQTERMDVLTTLGQKTRVLLVEDDEIIQKVHTNMLKHAGCEIEVANDGACALTMLEKNNYDLVFMDVGLPTMSGFEVTAIIRQREGEYKHTPIIALTGYGHDEDKSNCLQAGMDEVVTKPVRIEELMQLLQRWVVKKRL